MTHNGKILILSGSIGSGHISVARAIEEALHKKFPSVDVEIVDFLKVFANISTTATKKIYLGSLKISPKIWDVLFNHSAGQTWPLKVLKALTAPFNQRQCARMMEEKKPSLVVSNFPLWHLLIKNSAVPFVTMVTDSISIHPAWIMGDPDFFIVANEETKMSLRELGVENKKIKVLGYPVSSRFFAAARQSSSQKTLLLILSEGMGAGRIQKIADALAHTTIKNLNLVIIAGGEKKWKEKLEKIHWPFATHIRNWTDKIDTYIREADVILTKAGGSTVMECISCQKPMLIIDMIPGQEVGNALFVEKHDAGLVLKNIKDLDAMLQTIFKNEARMKKNMAALQKPHAADDIAEFLVSRL